MFNVIVRNSKGESISTTFIDQPQCTIGSGTDNAVVLPGWKVAKVHAELKLQDDGVHVANRAKLKALRVNDVKVEQYGPLTLGDTLTLDDYHIKVQIKGNSTREQHDADPNAQEFQHQKLREKLYWSVADALTDDHQNRTDAEQSATVHNLITTQLSQWQNIPVAIDRNRLGR